MHTVELLQEALETARRLGYEVRQDWLGGNGGGHCIVRGRKWLLLDVAQSADEQLDVVTEALRGDVGAERVVRSPELAQRLDVRRAA
ncbi:MAG: hypothetical protein L0228_20340 [Planctomycetes bacterium]|nr:hypothetical protein [Planctomycetota bacterium]